MTTIYHRLGTFRVPGHLYMVTLHCPTLATRLRMYPRLKSRLLRVAPNEFDALYPEHQAWIDAEFSLGIVFARHIPACEEPIEEIREGNSPGWSGASCDACTTLTRATSGHLHAQAEQTVTSRAQEE